MERSSFRRSRRATRGATAVASTILGTPVGVALPVQRHAPGHVLAWCGVELAAFALLVLTASVAGLCGVAAAGAVLLVLAATNRRRVLAITRSEIVVMTATLRARPLAPVGLAPRTLRFPEPRGIGVVLQLEDRRWWVDRSAYARLRRARELRPDLATGGG